MKTAKSRSELYLPEELWPEILSRLPAKSLLRFRCVSRSWKMWIDDPEFTRLHLNRFNNRSDSPILCVQDRVREGLELECVIKNSETLQTLFTLRFRNTELVSAFSLVFGPVTTRNGVAVRRWSILSTTATDGLFLLRWKHQPDLMLWNPSIRKTLPLPPLPEIPSQKPPESGIVEFGLVFEPVTRDYKVVRLIPVWKMGVLFAAVYTLSTNSWKLIDCQRDRERPCLGFVRAPSCVSFNGVIYGMAREDHILKLVSFDVRSEVFASSKWPRPQILYSKFYLTTVDDGCSLALVHVHDFQGSIWTMERLGDDTDAGSWIQRYTFVTVAVEELHHYDFLCFKKNGEMLVQWGNRVVCYNLETKRQKIVMQGNTKSFEVGNTVTYMESLILHSKPD